jgi:hypothetical protein
MRWRSQIQRMDATSSSVPTTSASSSRAGTFTGFFDFRSLDRLPPPTRDRFPGKCTDVAAFVQQHAVNSIYIVLPITRAVEQMRLRVEYDLEYLCRWSRSLDLRILLKTVGIVFLHGKAY